MESAYRGLTLILDAAKGEPILQALADDRERQAHDMIIALLGVGTKYRWWGGDTGGGNATDTMGRWWSMQKDEAWDYAFDRAGEEWLMIPVVLTADFEPTGMTDANDQTGDVYWQLDAGTPLTITDVEAYLPDRAKAAALLDDWRGITSPGNFDKPHWWEGDQVRINSGPIRSEAAKPKKEAEEPRVQVPMKATIKGPRRNPSSDQKKVQRLIQRKGSGIEIRIGDWILDTMLEATAWEDGKVVGAIEVAKPYYRTEKVFVRPTHRRRGIATMLLRALEAHLGRPLPPGDEMSPSGAAWGSAVTGRELYDTYAQDGRWDSWLDRLEVEATTKTAVGQHTAKGWWHDYEIDFKRTNNIAPWGPAEPKRELEALLQQILDSAGVPYGDEAYIHPSEKVGMESTTSCIGWDNGDGLLVPVVFLGSSMFDRLTIIHECAHHIDKWKTGQRGHAGADEMESHGAAWAAIFTRLLLDHYPEAHAYLAEGFSAHVGAQHTAAGRRTLYRGISLQGQSRQFAWGLDEALVRKFSRAMKKGDHQVAAKIMLDLCEESNEFVEGGKFGVWWSTDLSVARGYAGMHTRDSLACVIHAEIDDEDVFEGRGETHGFTSESPVVLREGASVDIVAIEVRYNPEQGTMSDGEFVEIPVRRQVTAAYGPPSALVREIERLRPQLAAVARELVDAWEQDDEGLDDEYGGGGPCDAVADAMSEVLGNAGYETTSGGADGDDHAWVVVLQGDLAVGVDIPPGVYETGGGYSWTKRPGVTIGPDDVAVWDLGPASDFHEGALHVGSDYRGQHQPPDDGPPLHDITEMFGDDVYEHPEWYWHGGGEPYDRESARVLKAMRNKPDAMVTIYRAAPPGLSTINTGDWVALSQNYCEIHSRHADDETKDWPVYAASVRVRDVRNGGNDIIEWGYWGPTVSARIVKGGAKTLDEAIEDLADVLTAPRPNAGYTPIWGDVPEVVDPDWSEVLSGVREVHRGYGVQVDPATSAWLFDPAVNIARKAEVVLDLVSRRGLGMHWTTHWGEAAGFAGMTADRGDLRVILTAATPRPDDVLSVADRTGNGVFRYDGQYGEQEIPIRPGATMAIEVVSWAPGGPRPMLRSDDGGGWVRYVTAARRQATWNHLDRSLW